jgi:hypothetical protein
VLVTPQAFDELVHSAQRRALHLELRDVYTYPGAFEEWLGGKTPDRNGDDEQWHAMIRPLVGRGVDVRRMRIVSEPVSAFIRFEHEITPAANLGAGERVRWLPRRQASDLSFPGNDFWLFDDTLLFHHFSGDGELLDVEVVDDPGLVKFCASSFEAAWDRGIDHSDYQPA